MPRSPLAPALALLAVLLVSGCGGADVASSTPAGASADASVEASSPEGALAAVDSAERALDRVLPPARPPVMVAVAPPPPPPPPVAPAGAAQQAAAPPQPMAEAPAPAPPPPRADASARERKEHAAPRQEVDSGGSCGTACSALASMERATAHLCEMTGPADARCTGARDRVKGASARVHAACPVCGG